MSDCKLVLVKEDVRFVVETGMQGPPGKSTYDLAVREGYSGTLQDWLTEQGVADIQLFQDSVDDLQQDLGGKSDVGHTHTESDITDLDKYTQAQTDSLLADKWDKQAIVQSAAFTAQANTRYWLTGTGTVTLPASANTGDKIELGKAGGTVNVSGQVVYEGTTDTNLEWDMETKLILVWNGSAWSVQLD